MSNLINKETGCEIAGVPEKLPPLRDGYIRLIHQTNFDCAESLAENGLVYNRDFAQKDGFSYYLDITSMALAYDEDSFWERLTKEEIRHKGANAIAIFDMPIEECGAHQREQITPMLGGTISRGYMVGIIPNYGTRDNTISEKLSVQEMEDKKSASKSNSLPPLYETPNWRENIEKAWNTFYEENEYVDSNNPFNHSIQNNDTENNSVLETDYAGWDWFDFGDEIETETNASSTHKPEYIYNEKTGEFNYKNSEFQQKADMRYKRKLENKDYLEYKLKRIKKKLGYAGLGDDMGKTGDSHTGEVSEKHKRVTEIQKETAKTSPTRFKQIIRNR